LGEIVELKTSGHGGTTPALKQPLGDLCARIADLSRQIEDHFLSFGSKIQDYSERAASITGMAMAASGTMSGEDIRGAIEGLEEMLDQLGGMFDSVNSASLQNQELLRSIGRALRSVQKDLAGLGSTSKDLKMLALSTKVQSTATGGGSTAFMQLGHDIARMSATISSKTSDLFHETSALSGFVTDVQDSFQALKKKQKFQAEKVLTGTRNIISSMLDQSVKSVQEAEMIRESSEEISADVSHMITSVQVQDITRQAMDRVTVGLKSILNAAPGRDHAEGDPGEPPMVSREMSFLLEFLKQVRCLEKNDLVIKEALEQMDLSLRDIMKNIEGMAALTRAANLDSTKFLSELQVAISSVKALIVEVMESGQEMSDSMNSLAHTVGGMSGFTEDIEMMSSDVELISLNARIMAAQTGVEGAGMSVIASAVQETAHSAEGQRSSVVGKLTEIREAAVGLKAEMEQSTFSEAARPDQLVRELGVFLDALRTIQKKVVTILHDIDQMSSSLVRDLGSTVDEIHGRMVLECRSTDITRDIHSLALDLVPSVDVKELQMISGSRYGLEVLRGMGHTSRMEIVKEYCSRQDGAGTSREVHAMSSGDGDVTLFVDDHGKGGRE